MVLPAGSRRLTTIITVSVVLVAGSAAALVNSHVLTRSADNASSGVPLSIVEEPTTTVADTVPTTIPVTESTLSPTQSAYQADAAGQVVVDTDGGALSIVSVVPNDGYRVESMSQGLDPNNVSVFFRAPDGSLYEFHAGLMAGVVGASIALVDETSTTVDGGGSGSGGSVTPTPSSTLTTVDDNGGDDDDDEIDDDEVDDEEDEEDEEDEIDEDD
ncbi:MAG: hypothetical protein ACO3AV_03010 [Ilumatobacteraceae bacterium]